VLPLLGVVVVGVLVLRSVLVVMMDVAVYSAAAAKAEAADEGGRSCGANDVEECTRRPGMDDGRRMVSGC